MENRYANTWGIYLLDASQQGLNPDYTITDASQVLHAGQKGTWGDRSCHRDVFHIQHQCETLVNTLAGIAKGVRSRRKKLETKRGKARRIRTLPNRSRLPGRPKRKRERMRMRRLATSEHLPYGSLTMSWRWPVRA